MGADEGLTTSFFEERVRQIRANLPDGVRSVVVVRGQQTDKVPQYFLTASMQVYLMRAEIANTIVVVTPNHVYVLSRQVKEKSSLAMLAKDVPGVTCIVCNSKTDTNRDAIKTAVDAIANAGGNVGVFAQDRKLMEGKFFAEVFYEMFDSLGTPHQDVTEEMRALLRVKDNLEVDMHRKAGLFANIITQRSVVPAIEEGVDDKEAGADVATKIDGVIDDPSGVKQLETVTDGAGAFDTVVLTGDFKPDFPGASTKGELQPLNVAVVIGARWKSYTTVVGRTYLFNATDDMKKHYDAALALRKQLIDLATPGRAVADYHAAALASVPEDMRAHVHVHFGFGTGIEYNDAALQLTADSKATLMEGNMLVLRVHLGGLRRGAAAADGEGDKAEANSTYAIQLLDTVVVSAEKKEKEGWQVLTNAAKVEPSKCFFEFSEEESIAEEPAPLIEMELRASTMNYGDSRAGMWTTQQKEILEANREAFANLSKEGRKNRSKEDKSTAGKLARGQLAKVFESRPPKGSYRVHVDEESGVIYLPVDKQLVPFHASTINATRQVCDTTHYSMIITFKTTVAGFTPYTTHPKLAFLKEITMKAPLDMKTRLEADRTKMRNLINLYKKRDTQGGGGDDDFVSTAGLQKRPGGGSPVLKQVWCKPPLMKGKGSQKQLGNCEAHQNGLRYVLKDGTHIDLLYNNIKHVIACPNTEKHERVAAVHIRLISPIQLPSGTKTRDLHLWMEVSDAQDDDLNKTRLNKSEREEDMEDEREQKIINQINREFVKFCADLKGQLPPTASIEIPRAYPNGYFEGLAGGSLTWIAATPTTLTAVLDTTQFFVLSMKDVEVVIFERVVHGQKNFDMVFVMKDYNQPPQRIDNVPKTAMPMVKDMLCGQYKLRYYEVENSTKWTEVMKTVKKAEESDEGFNPWSMGGWEGMFNLDASESGSDSESESEDSDSEFEPSSSSEDSSDNAWEAGSESMGSDDDDDDESTASSSEPKKKKRKRDDSDDGKKKKKRK